MSPRLRTIPRKMPRQHRSKATVEALLSATARVLVKSGYDGTSTNRVAKVAGVSVGSLYQYFPSKEALVVAVMDRHCDRIFDLIASTMKENADAPVPVMARALVRMMLQAHSHDPALHRVLMEQLPRVGRLSRLRQMQNELGKRALAYLKTRPREISPRNLELAVFILMNLIESVTHAVVERPEDFGLAQVEEEMTAVILSYLQPAASLRRAS